MQVVQAKMHRRSNKNGEKWRKTCVKNVLSVHMKFTCCRTELEQWLLFPRFAFESLSWSEEKTRIRIILLSLLIEFYLLLVFIINVVAGCFCCFGNSTPKMWCRTEERSGTDNGRKLTVHSYENECQSFGKEIATSERVKANQIWSCVFSTCTTQSVHFGW